MKKSYRVVIRTAKFTHVISLEVESINDIVQKVFNYFQDNKIVGECPYIITSIDLEEPDQYFV